MQLNFKTLILATLTPVAILFAGNVTAETQVTKSISYFSIVGKTAEELDAALAEHGPEDAQSGIKHLGITKISFGGDITYATAERSCAIEKVNVTLSTEIKLPRWKDRRRAAPELAIAWDALSSDIKRHEARHAEIARQHAKKLDESLMRLRPEKSCERLKQRISAVTQTIMDEHDADQSRFDRVESHNFDDRLERIITQRQQLAAE